MEEGGSALNTKRENDLGICACSKSFLLNKRLQQIGTNLELSKGRASAIKDYLVTKPSPVYYFSMSGFFVELRKDIYNTKYLNTFGLSERQIRAVLLAKEKGKVTTREYQQIKNV